MRAYIEKRHLPISINSLETAYAELVREGYIKTSPEAVVSAGGGTKLIDLGGEYLPHGTRQNLRVTNKVLADVNRMSAKEYQDALRDPEYRAQVEAALSH
jgi:DNA-binding transcriptional MocR family regulator